MRALDDRREELGLSKAELARRAELAPEAVRRLFSVDSPNPTIGVTGLRFHDLRHTGNTLAAATGASTKELMSRMGQSSSRAALVYQHATQDRDAVIAESLSSMITEHRSKSS